MSSHSKVMTDKRIILEDTRNQAGKHENVHRQLKAMGFEVVRTKLAVGDYTLPTDQSVCIDTKKDLPELVNNVCQGHDRFIRELSLAKRLGINLVVLCEHGNHINDLSDVNRWVNPRLRVSKLALSGPRLFKVLYSIQCKYGVPFLFCDPSMTGERIVQLLK